MQVHERRRFCSHSSSCGNPQTKPTASINSQSVFSPPLTPSLSRPSSTTTSALSSFSQATISIPASSSTTSVPQMNSHKQLKPSFSSRHPPSFSPSPHSNSFSRTHPKSLSVGVVVGICVSVFAALALISICGIWWYRRLRRRNGAEKARSYSSSTDRTYFADASRMESNGEQITQTRPLHLSNRSLREAISASSLDSTSLHGPPVLISGSPPAIIPIMGPPSPSTFESVHAENVGVLQHSTPPDSENRPDKLGLLVEALHMPPTSNGSNFWEIGLSGRDSPYSANE